jgi:hypothetical protein
MQLWKRRLRFQQSRLLFADDTQAELWNRLDPEHQQLCRTLLGQLLQQVGNAPDPAGASDERSSHE